MGKDILVVAKGSEEVASLVRKNEGTTVVLFDERLYKLRYVNCLENLFLRGLKSEDGRKKFERRARLMVGDAYRLPEDALEKSEGNFDHFLSDAPDFRDAALSTAFEYMLPLLSAVAQTKSKVWIVGDVPTRHHNLTLYGGYLFSNPVTSERLANQMINVVTDVQMLPGTKIALLARGALENYALLCDADQILISGSSLEVNDEPDDSAVISVEMLCRKTGWMHI